MPGDTSSTTFQLGGDLGIHRFGFGTIYLTVQRAFGPLRPAARDLLNKAVNLGVTFIDTADSYGLGHAENVIAEALHPYPGNLVIATNGGFLHRALDDWQAHGRPDHLRQACDGSLKLKVERSDLYQLHTPGRRGPLCGICRCLEEAARGGKDTPIGGSNVTLPQLEMARREVAVVSVQNPYNLGYLGRRKPREPVCPEGIAFIPWIRWRKD